MSDITLIYVGGILLYIAALFVMVFLTDNFRVRFQGQTVLPAIATGATTLAFSFMVTINHLWPPAGTYMRVFVADAFGIALSEQYESNLLVVILFFVVGVFATWVTATVLPVHLRSSRKYRSRWRSVSRDDIESLRWQPAREDGPSLEFSDGMIYYGSTLDGFAITWKYVIRDGVISSTSPRPDRVFYALISKDRTNLEFFTPGRSWRDYSRGLSESGERQTELYRGRTVVEAAKDEAREQERHEDRMKYLDRRNEDFVAGIQCCVCHESVQDGDSVYCAVAVTSTVEKIESVTSSGGYKYTTTTEHTARVLEAVEGVTCDPCLKLAKARKDKQSWLLALTRKDLHEHEKSVELDEFARQPPGSGIVSYDASVRLAYCPVSQAEYKSGAADVPFERWLDLDRLDVANLEEYQRTRWGMTIPDDV